MFWGGIEKDIERQLHIQDHLFPTLPIEQDIFYGGQILESSWYKILTGPQPSSKSSSGSKPGTALRSSCELSPGEGAAGTKAEATVAGEATGGRARVASAAAGKPGRGGSPDNLHVMADIGSSSSNSSSACEDGTAAIRGAAVVASKGRKQAAWLCDEGAGAAAGTAKVTAVQGMVAGFMSHGVRLVSGGVLPADIVVYCTGYTKSYDYLEGSVKVRNGNQKQGP
jgi:hypothetical protein